MLRPGEIDQLRVGDFCFPEAPELAEGVGLVVSIRQAKTRRVWAKQFVIIDSKELVAWCRWWTEGKGPKQRFLSPSRRRWSQVLVEALEILDLNSCGFTLSSMRGGGACHHFKTQKNLGLLQFAGRWRRPETLRHYLQDVLGIHALAQAPSTAREKLLQTYEQVPLLLTPPPLARREPGTPGVGRGARRPTDAEADAVDRPEVVAAALYEAAETAAKGLSQQSVGNGLSGAEMLQSPENRAVAARWRSGDAGRRVTAALARAMQALQEWAGGTRAPSRGTLAVLLAVFLFPRVWALLIALVVRLLSRALLSFAAHFLSELYAQVVFGAAEVEQQLVEWLQWQLGWPSPAAPPAYLTNGAPTTPPQAPPPPGPTALPTRPIDLLTLLLLALQLRSEKIQGLFGDAPEYISMLRLSFVELPAFFAVLMLAYHDGNPGAPAPADQSCQGPKLILHVGPKKTGTSALQDFLVQRATWLDEVWAIGVGFREVKVAAYDLAIPLWEENRIEKDKCEPKQNAEKLSESVQYIKSLLQRRSLVVVSSEAFGSPSFTNISWQCFKSLIEPGACLSVVVVHRSAATWMASVWSASNKLLSAPQSFESFMASYAGQRRTDAQGDSDPQLQVLNLLNQEFPGRVDAVSYDYLEEVNMSLAAFFICNATLRLAGEHWHRCQKSVPRARVVNKSPLHAAVDVVRLARIYYSARQTALNKTSPCKPWPIVDLRRRGAPSNPDGVLIAYNNPAVADIAKQLPQKCEILDGLFESVTQKWFARTGAQRPRNGSKPICTVDITAMRPEHWQLLGRVVPDCQE
ncbi:unnamed protein product [Symbiodinium sp. CCMP2592]|nr:unnamed protein product [Symbiodinium sp. CCMP2592]